MHTNLKNKITLVTGVSSGIGREIAQLLAARGARVFGTEQGITEEEALKKGMEEKSKEFVERGAKVYAMA